MTQIEWQYLESMIGAMTPEDKHRLVVMLGAPTSVDVWRKAEQQELEFTRRLAAESEKLAELRGNSMTSEGAPTTDDSDPIIGCMADESDLLDEIMEGVYRDREHLPFRASE